ncbi:MAG: hypothetical protein ABSG92_06230 [Conexivisphaerales archaeon]|jgi:hypothetical protein
MTTCSQVPIADARSILCTATGLGDIGGSILGRGTDMPCEAQDAVDSLHDARWREAKMKSLEDMKKSDDISAKVDRERKDIEKEIQQAERDIPEQM